MMEKSMRGLSLDTSKPTGRSSRIYKSVPKDCDICQHIMHGFHTPFQETYTAELGTAPEVLSKSCSSHDPLLAGLKAGIGSGGVSSISAEDAKTAKVRVKKLPDVTNLDITLDGKHTGGAIVECFQLVKKPTPEHAGRGVVPDAQWIDPRLFTKWKACCQELHGDDCEEPLERYWLPEDVPDWLVDVQNKCLVPGEEGKNFVALSYRWGDSARPVLRKALLTKLQEPKGFLKQEDLEIPDTIKNAMEIVKLLGERYLWTDSLCIVADDESLKYQALTQMASIYASSVVTIIAADGEDADAGIKGIKGISEPRNLKDRYMPFGSNEQVIKPKFPWFHRQHTEYSNRGWTFQEYLFSKRRLIFEGGMVRWECSRSAWQEDIVHVDTIDSRFRSNWMDVITLQYPSLTAFGNMLMENNARKFTYEEDALPAFTGFLSMLSRKFEGGFLCGLPEMYFEAALNWAPWAQDLKRRTSSGRSSASKFLTVLPSWSWIGWEGRISGGWRSNEDFIKRGRFTVPIYTVPVTKLYTANRPTSENRREISSSFLRERATHKKQHLTRPMPEGWTRHNHDPEDSPKKRTLASRDGSFYEYPPPDGCGSCFYTHEDVPAIEFWYPIPIMSEDDDPILPAQTQYLFCKTQKASFSATDEDSTSKTPNRHLWLRDEEDTWAGVLLLHSLEDKKASKAKTQVELVAVSRGYIASDERIHAPVEMNHAERPKDSKFYKFYNVLWVEWKDGVAYRKGNGRVLKDMWEEEETEMVDLILG